MDTRIHIIIRHMVAALDGQVQIIRIDLCRIPPFIYIVIFDDRIIQRQGACRGVELCFAVIQDIIHVFEADLCRAEPQVICFTDIRGVLTDELQLAELEGRAAVQGVDRKAEIHVGGRLRDVE